VKCWRHLYGVPGVDGDWASFSEKKDGQTMILKSSKINEFRLWGLLLTLIGMAVMILGTAAVLIWGAAGRPITIVGLVFGMLFMIGSMVVYFWAGIMSTSALIIECPECGKQTKMLGKSDRCMHCKTILSLEESPRSAASDGGAERETSGR
jgi:hypothetical protein